MDRPGAPDYPSHMNVPPPTSGPAGSPLLAARSSLARFAFAVVAVATLCGCFGPLARRRADRAVYPILEAKQIEALGRARDAEIDPPPDPFTLDVLSSATLASDEFSTEGLRLSLADTLALAFTNNRAYRSRKESLYLAALDLTEARRDFSPIFTGFLAGGYDRTPVLEGDAVVDSTTRGTVDGRIGVGKVIAATGARVTLGVTQGFLRFGGGAPDASAAGAASLSVVQPLLRGAGPRVAVEGLRQAERDVIYAVRDFARFEKDFLVDRIEEYFRLLQTLDQVENERRSYDSLEYGRERTEAMAEAGRLDVFQVEQARQQELSARNRLINARTAFQQRQDLLKVNLGLPTDIAIFPDPEDLRELERLGLLPVELEQRTAIGRALEERLDQKTATDRIQDAERKVYLAENGLLPDLDARADLVFRDDASNQPLSFDVRNRDTALGATLELPLDRRLERNTYRRALVALERARRDADFGRDSIVQEVRGSFQTLDQARLSYEIQQQSLDVARRRVESSQMLLEAERKTVRDVLESEEDFVNAGNALTRALVDYHLARLRFLVAIEGIEIDDGGLWRENVAAPAAETAEPEIVGGG